METSPADAKAIPASYNFHMNKNPYFTLFAACLVAGLATAPSLYAEEDVLPPPTTIHDSDQARETIVKDGGETDLNKELSAPENKGLDGSEVRAYTRGDGAEITEYSVKGKVYMIRVKPSGNLPAYYLYDSNGDGVYERRLPGGYKTPSPPMWVIKKF